MNDQTTVAEPNTKLARIEDKLDRNTLSEVSATGGGVQFRTMTEVMEFAKLVSLSGVAVPPHLRGNPGACLAVCIQAMEWKMSPFAVANKSYVVANYSKDGPIERLSYESQLIHAVIEARAPLQARLRVEYEGEGDDRVCVVSGTFRGETVPHELRSSPLGKRRPGKNDKGYIKGSPLWETKPDLQQFYDTSRDWCRMYCPDVLMGIYAPDEFEEIEPIEPKVVSPNLMERLPGKIEGAGFATDVVQNGLKEDKPKPPRKKKDDAPVETTAASPPVETTPAATAEERPAAPMPTNLKTYRAWVVEWLPSFDASEDINDRWRAERKLRNACGLVSEDTAKIKELVDERIKAL